MTDNDFVHHIIASPLMTSTICVRTVAKRDDFLIPVWGTKFRAFLFSGRFQKGIFVDEELFSIALSPFLSANKLIYNFIMWFIL